MNQCTKCWLPGDTNAAGFWEVCVSAASKGEPCEMPPPTLGRRLDAWIGRNGVPVAVAAAVPILSTIGAICAVICAVSAGLEMSALHEKHEKLMAEHARLVAEGKRIQRRWSPAILPAQVFQARVDPADIQVSG